MTTATAKESKVKRFRIIAGKLSLGKGRSLEHPNRKCSFYASRDKMGNLRKDLEGKDIPDVIETEKNLVKVFGTHRYIRLHAPLDDGLAKFSLKELIEYAEGEEMDLGEATKKEDVLSRIRIALG